MSLSNIVFRQFLQSLVFIEINLLILGLHDGSLLTLCSWAFAQNGVANVSDVSVLHHQGRSEKGVYISSRSRSPQRCIICIYPLL